MNDRNNGYEMSEGRCAKVKPGQHIERERNGYLSTSNVTTVAAKSSSTCKCTWVVKTLVQNERTDGKELNKTQSVKMWLFTIMIRHNLRGRLKHSSLDTMCPYLSFSSQSSFSTCYDKY